LPKRFPNPGVVALAAISVALLGVLLWDLVGGLLLAAGLRAASLLDAGHGQTAGAEAVQGHGGGVAAGEGVLEVARFSCVFGYRSLLFWELGLGVSWTVRGRMWVVVVVERMFRRCVGGQYMYVGIASIDNARLLGLSNKGKIMHVSQDKERPCFSSVF
jgi:hypothetical protein